MLLGDICATASVSCSSGRSDVAGDPKEKESDEGDDESADESDMGEAVSGGDGERNDEVLVLRRIEDGSSTSAFSFMLSAS